MAGVEFKFDKAKIEAIVKKHGKEIAKEILIEVLEPALKNVIAASENKIDDALFAVAYEPLKAELIKLIDGL